MMKSRSNRRVVRAVLCAALGAMVMLSTASLSARAGDDDDDDQDVPADVKFFRNILAGLGLQRDGDGINYRERSPLVVPPNLTLPPPETTNLAAKNPAWPKDPDVQRAKKLRAERKKPRKTVEEESLPETPAHLNKPGAAISRTSQQPTGDTNDPTRPSSNAELNVKSIFNWDTLTGKHHDEYTTFASEPPRTSLIEPPPGYRTPSPAQPYGVGPEKWKPGAINPMDTPEMRGTQ